MKIYFARARFFFSNNQDVLNNDGAGTRIEKLINSRGPRGIFNVYVKIDLNNRSNVILSSIT